MTKWGYEVRCVSDFGNVLSDVVSFEPHLVLMDIGLPFYNGYYWCGEIRKVSKVPIFFLSSASDNMNIIMAVNMGGDEFIAKPFDLEVLAAKIQAVLRRAYSFKEASSLLEYRDVILNMTDMSFLYNGEKRELSKNEFRILQILFENAGNAVTREEMMRRLLSYLRTAESAFARRICQEFLSAASPATTGVSIRNPRASACTFAGRFWTGLHIPFGWNPKWEREQRSLSDLLGKKCDRNVSLEQGNVSRIDGSAFPFFYDIENFRRTKGENLSCRFWKSKI